MQFSFGKLFIAAGCGLLGSIFGGCLAGWRAAAFVARAGVGAHGEEADPLAQASPHVVGSTVSAVLHGVLIGGLIGLVLGIAAIVIYDLYGDRVRPEREVSDPYE
jgi:hypothetical protein